MKITVAGLWHLGCVTAACCASHFEVTGLDFDEETVSGLRTGRPPVHEPGLAELLRARIGDGSLSLSTDPKQACANADVLWICYDTPVNADDEADVGSVLANIRRCLPHLQDDAIVLISSQLPAGTCRQLEQENAERSLTFAYSPENLRLGLALDAFRHPERIVIGARNDNVKPHLSRLFAPFSEHILWMTPESAEMTKHAINAFLALSITFTNELARLCEMIGADAKEVEEGLKSEPRIGRRAYVAPGGPIAGGTLARDVRFLIDLGAAAQEPLSILPASLESNARHKLWPLRRLEGAFDTLLNRHVTVLGLTYKPGTDTLRRSSAIELCHALQDRGCRVNCYDPAVPTLPEDLRNVTVSDTAQKALVGADAAVICTEWPQFYQVDWATCIQSMRRPLIIDANRFLLDSIRHLPEVEYRAVGMPG